MKQVEIDLLYGLVGTLLFTYRNPDRNHAYPIATLFVGLFLSQIVYLYFDNLPGQILWLISAVGLLFFYSLRLFKKPTRNLMIFLKALGLLLLIMYPLPFYSILGVGDNIIWILVRALTFSMVATIYLYDRWILKPDQMKSKYLIVLAVQTVLILVLLIYSFYQKVQADFSQEQAVYAQGAAERQRVEVEKLRVKVDSLSNQLKLKEESSH